jgi:hypothetical protein
MQRAGDIISNLVIPANMKKVETVASVPLNFAIIKLK